MNVYRRHCCLLLLPAGLCALWLCCAVLLFYAAPPLYAPAGYWMPELLTLQQERMARQQDQRPRLLVCAGSSALYGLHTPLLEARTGYAVYNLSGTVQMDLTYHFSHMKKYARRGDTVLLPLEYWQYKRGALPEAYAVTQYGTWAREELSALSFSAWKEAMGRILPTYPLPLRQARPLPVRPAPEIAALLTAKEHAEAAAPAASLTPPSGKERLEDTNASGEFFVDQPPVAGLAPLREHGIDYLGGKPMPAHAQAALQDMARWAQAAGVRLLISWAPSVRNKTFDLRLPEHWRRLEARRAEIEACGIPVIGDGRCFNMDMRYFFNTDYHLNATGAVLRTLHLADALREAGRRTPLSEQELAARSAAHEAEAAAYVRALSRPRS